MSRELSEALTEGLTSLSRQNEVRIAGLKFIERQRDEGL